MGAAQVYKKAGQDSATVFDHKKKAFMGNLSLRKLRWGAKRQIANNKLNLAPNFVHPGCTVNMIESPVTKTRWKVARHNSFLWSQRRTNKGDIVELIIMEYGFFGMNTG
jgi:hypothetical protein